MHRLTRSLSIAAMLAATASVATAATETILHSFAGGPKDGDEPISNLIADSAGNLYGATQFGGKFSGGTAYFCSFQGCGTIFKITPDGVESLLYSFTGGNDGSIPGGLIADGAGDFYGATAFGGTSSDGVVFKLTPGGHETVLYSFGGSPDGADPDPGLFVGRDGTLYGTTASGGADSCFGLGCGTIFKITSSGKESVLYSFAGTPDGNFPTGLITDDAGNFYGATSQGGKPGDGTIFNSRRPERSQCCTPSRAVMMGVAPHMV